MKHIEWADCIWDVSQWNAPLQWHRSQRVVVEFDKIDDSTARQVIEFIGDEQQNTFFLLTKHPERMQKLFTGWVSEGDFATLIGSTEPAFPWPNLWIGVEVQDQQTADERIPILLQTPGSARFCVCSLHGPIDLTKVAFTKQTWAWGQIYRKTDALTGRVYRSDYKGPWVSTVVTGRLDWVIVSGKSSLGAQLWVQNMREQCQNAGVPFFFDGDDAVR